jgi:hypothetical protein
MSDYKKQPIGTWEGIPIYPAHPPIPDDIDSQIISTAKAALLKEALTDDEKFAIAYMAGAPTHRVLGVDIQSGQSKSALHIETAVPCDVQRINGHWHVVQKG